MKKAPILKHLNLNYPFLIETDTNDKGLGAVLIQRNGDKTSMIQYISRTLQPCENKSHIRKKEALAIVRLVLSLQLREYLLSMYHNHKQSILHMASDKMRSLFKKVSIG